MSRYKINKAGLLVENKRIQYSSDRKHFNGRSLNGNTETAKLKNRMSSVLPNQNSYKYESYRNKMCALA